MSLLDTLTQTLVKTYAEKLSEQEQKELIQALEIIANEQKYNKFKNFFPDEGEYKRALYPKHVSFFNAGATYTERAFVAGNRVGKCLSYRTLIELADGTEEQAGVLYEKKQPFNVMAWDGEKAVVATVTDFIKKEPETVYRVWLENGEWFECAANHRVLCQDGSWRFVGTFLEGLPNLPLTIEDNGLQAQFLDVLRYLRTIPDSQADYLVGCRFCGEQLPAGANTGQERLPVLDDVQQHISASWRMGGQGNKHTYICQPCVSHLAILGDDFHALGQYVLGEGQAFSPDAQPLIQNIQNTLLSLRSSGLVGATLERLSRKFQFVALKSPLFMDGNRVIAYSTIGVNDVYDFTVEPHHNYISHGIVHHNSEAGCYETVCHLTGEYPSWWEGRRYHNPILAWVGGDTATTCRDIVQKKFLGEITDIGSGMLPKASIVEHKTRRNVPDAVETIRVRHISGGVSTLVIKTYEQGRATWQGSEVDWIWMDEECPQEVYGEALIRLMTTNGSIITTFTPLQGVTDLVLSLLENSQDTDSTNPKYVQVVSWDDVPHISEEMKRKMLEATPPQLREARSKGVPTVGSGLIYPVDPKNVIVDDFKVPAHWQRLCGMDVGWQNTAAVWGAWDRDNDIIYIYSEHKQGQAEPVIHAKAIKARGEWIKVAIDPASRGRSQTDGESLWALYRKEGLKLIPANNSVESGIFTVWERLSTGRLKIFKSCTGLLRELSLYHRDEKGKIVKNNDHLLDSTRYLIHSEPTAWSYPQVDNRQKVVPIRNYLVAHH